MSDAMQDGEKEYVKSLTQEERQEFYAMSKERKKKCVTENILSQQDEQMWEKNEGISQLEHRIHTDSFQG